MTPTSTRCHTSRSLAAAVVAITQGHPTITAATVQREGRWISIDYHEHGRRIVTQPAASPQLALTRFINCACCALALPSLLS